VLGAPIRTAEKSPYVPTQYDPADSDLPDDLRLPTPASIWERVYAGGMDAAAASILSVVPFIGCSVAGLDLDMSIAAAAGYAGFAFCVRDWLWEEGTRSMGKAMAGLELTSWDGQLVGSGTALVRNLHTAVIFGGMAAPTSILQHPASLLLIFDTASVMSTSDGRRTGDYMLGSRVSLSEDGRAERLLDLMEG